MYEPQVDDYVGWTNELGQIHEGWVYFKGDPVDNVKRKKEGWNSISQYITIELGVKPKPHCVYSSGKPMRHKNIHILVLCNRENWGELEYIRNRRDELTSDRPLENKEEQVGIKMYKSQEGRYLDVQ